MPCTKTGWFEGPRPQQRGGAGASGKPQQISSMPRGVSPDQLVLNASIAVRRPISRDESSSAACPAKRLAKASACCPIVNPTETTTPKFSSWQEKLDDSY